MTILVVDDEALLVNHAAQDLLFPLGEFHLSSSLALILLEC